MKKREHKYSVSYYADFGKMGLTKHIKNLHNKIKDHKHSQSTLD
jgi:hypothetical protein